MSQEDAQGKVSYIDWRTNTVAVDELMGLSKDYPVETAVAEGQGQLLERNKAICKADSSQSKLRKSISSF